MIGHAICRKRNTKGLHSSYKCSKTISPFQNTSPKRNLTPLVFIQPCVLLTSRKTYCRKVASVGCLQSVINSEGRAVPKASVPPHAAQGAFARHRCGVGARPHLYFEEFAVPQDKEKCTPPYKEWVIVISAPRPTSSQNMSTSASKSRVEFQLFDSWNSESEYDWVTSFCVVSHLKRWGGGRGISYALWYLCEFAT